MLDNLSPHGRFNFSIENENILIINGRGPWNKEAVAHLGDDQESLLKSLYGKPWGVLAIISGDPVHTQEASELLANIVYEDKQKGRKASALIFKDCNFPEIGKHDISKIYNKANEKYEFFDDRNAATSWLKEII